MVFLLWGLMKHLFPLALALALCAAPCRADVSLPSIFGDNMVIQQRQKIDVWGKADPNETVTVQLGPDTAQVNAGKDGNWSVRLDPIKSGGPYDMTVYGKNSLIVRNIAIGEVWVCAGESNMEFKVDEARNGLEEASDGDLPMVRVFNVWHNAADQPRAECDGAWVVCDPDTAKNFSAVAFFFARELNRSMRVPIGLIQTTWAGAPAESWTPLDVLRKDPDFHAALDRYNKLAADYPQAQAAYQSKLLAWKTAADAAKVSGSPAPPAPVPPAEPQGPRQPAGAYNGMIAPLTRFGIRGVLWYQGESNTYEPLVYRKLFPAMIESWRKAWNEGDFPFLYAQLSTFLAPHPQPVESRWADLREAQAMALTLPKTGMAVTVDIGEVNNMHPPDKQDVAHRLALIAENMVYDKPEVVDSGPVYSGMKIADGKATISFTHADGLAERNGPPLKGFQIAGDDRKFVWAGAEIHGSQVIVQSKEVPNPVAVRYAWADYPECTLVNKEDLPAAPFRTDNWGPGESTPTPTPSPSPAHKSRHHSTPAN